jgi:hypothetical protein
MSSAATMVNETGGFCFTNKTLLLPANTNAAKKLIFFVT